MSIKILAEDFQRDLHLEIIWTLLDVTVDSFNISTLACNVIHVQLFV